MHRDTSSFLFDHIVGGDEQPSRHGQSEGFRGFEINYGDSAFN
jgi:hypothetical protein